LFYENPGEGQQKMLHRLVPKSNSQKKSAPNDLKFSSAVGMGKTNIQMESESISIIFERFTEI